MSDENKSLRLSSEQEEEVITRCFRVVDYLNEVAVNIITEFVQNITCPEAKKILLNAPEVIAIKAFEKALNNLVSGGRHPEGRVH